MVIYKITNLINMKAYIGQTKGSIEVRFKSHQHVSSKKQIIGSAIRKYGRSNFTIEVIDVATSKEELDEKERYWIDFYKSTDRKHGYNLTSGGASGFKISEKNLNSLKSRRGKKQPKTTIYIDVVCLESGERFTFHGASAAAAFAGTSKSVISKSCCKKNGGRIIINEKFTAVHRGDEVGKIINTPRKNITVTYPDGRVEDYKSMIEASSILKLQREVIQAFAEHEVKDKHGRQWKFKNRY